MQQNALIAYTNLLCADWLNCGGECFPPHDFTARYRKAEDRSGADTPPKHCKYSIKEVESVHSMSPWIGNYWRRIPFGKVSFLKVAHKALHYLSPEDFEKLVSVITEEQFKDIVMFAVCTGCRRAE